jgi:hypothetical protein
LNLSAQYFRDGCRVIKYNYKKKRCGDKAAPIHKSKVMTKIVNLSDNSEINNFRVNSKLHPRVIAGLNGTPAGVSALAESLKRGNAFVEAQKRINDVCLPSKTTLSNTFINDESEAINA